MTDNVSTKTEKLLTSKQAADVLQYAERTLRGSRVSGYLAGRKTPPYIRRGRQILYNLNDLTEWQSQFEKTH